MFWISQALISEKTDCDKDTPCLIINAYEPLVTYGFPSCCVWGFQASKALNKSGQINVSLVSAQ